VLDRVAREACIVELDDQPGEEARAVAGLDVVTAVDDIERALVEEPREARDQAGLITGRE